MSFDSHKLQRQTRVYSPRCCLGTVANPATLYANACSQRTQILSTNSYRQFNNLWHFCGVIQCCAFIHSFAGGTN